jgi:SOS-response transcriptional repressor LexA
MNEKQTQSLTHVRPTKKQRELLNFIGNFITAHGYSPSYREIMAGLGYTSVATVSLHVRSLISRGHLRKRDYSARSLELTEPLAETKVATNQIAPNEEKWLIEKVEYLFQRVERQGKQGTEAAAQSFQPRLQPVKR